jgi:serine/threonine-protein kinase RsbW
MMRSGGGQMRVISLFFPATGGAVRDALIAVDAALAAAKVESGLRERAQIALAEACNNIVEHAYATQDDARDPMITLDIAADLGGLQVILRDRGGPMPEGGLPGGELPDIDPDDPCGLPEGGWGWPLLRRMARSLSLSRRENQNILRFRLPLVETAGQTGRNAM